MLIDNATYQRETLSERLIRQPLKHKPDKYMLPARDSGSTNIFIICQLYRVSLQKV